MVADADAEVDAGEPQDEGDGEGAPREEEKGGDGQGMEEDHEDNVEPVGGAALGGSAEGVGRDFDDGRRAHEEDTIRESFRAG